MNERIVTTKMPDCRKYKSVLIIKDEKEFIEKLQEALKLKIITRQMLLLI